MRRSFLRLVIVTVLVSWLTLIVGTAVYFIGQDWTPEQARKQGVFLVHRSLDPLPATERDAQLDGLGGRIRRPFRPARGPDTRVTVPMLPHDRLRY